MIKFLTCLIILLSSLYAAAESKNKKTTVAQDIPMTLNVNYGTQVTIYEIVKTAKGGTIIHRDSKGELIEKEITKKNYNYFVTEFKTIKGQNKKEFCERNFIEFKRGDKKHLGCIGSATPVARRLTGLSNAITLLL